MITTKTELTRENGKRIADKSLSACSALEKAGKRDVVVRAKYRYKSRPGLNSMIEDERSDKMKNVFEALVVIGRESIREYVDSAKGLTGAVTYHRIEVPDEKIRRTI